MGTRTFGCAAILIGLVVMSAGPVAAEDSGAACNATLLQAKLVDGDFADAQREAQRCADGFRDAMAKGGDFNNMGSQDFVTVANANHYDEANAQLLALMGDFSGAERYKDSAQAIRSSNANFQSFLIAGTVDAVSNATDGLIHEMKGELAEAQRIYTSSGSSYAKGRLALLALNAANFSDAQRLATEGSVMGDATSYAVLGTLAERSGDKAGAFVDYKKAHDLLVSVEPNNIVPIFYAEASRIAHGLAD